MIDYGLIILALYVFFAGTLSLCLLKKKKNKKKWISIKDELPECNEDIIACGFYRDNGKDEFVFEGGFRSETDRVEDLKKGNFVDFYFKVTHWMIPENPNER